MKLRHQGHIHRLVIACGIALTGAQAPAVEFPNTMKDGWCDSVLVPPEGTTTRASMATTAPASPSSTDALSRELILSLSLSGGGFRAMLFHVGTLRRLNDAGMLPRLTVISSVSGGSIVSAYLALHWNELLFEESDRAGNFDDVIEQPLRKLTGTTLDFPSVLVGLLPFTSSAEQQVSRFDEQLFHGALLSSIARGGPAGTPASRPRPLFILNATSLQTGELWQFRPTVMGGPITGWTDTGSTLLSQAVAASSGFPPFLSPLVLHPSAGSDNTRWHSCVDYRDNPYGVAYANEPGRVVAPEALSDYRQSVHLIDGGVRDNLGIAVIEEMNRMRRLRNVARATATLMSDGGATTRLDRDPASNWASQGWRVLNLLSDQPDEVRVGNIIRAGSQRLRKFEWNAGPTQPGCTDESPPAKLEAARRHAALDAEVDAFAYWSIRRMPKLHTGFSCPDPSPRWMADEVADLSALPTAFRALSPAKQARLINWGYLAAHHGLPYLDFAWPDPGLRRRWLAPCTVPYGPDATETPEERAPSSRDARCSELLHLK